MAEAIQVRLFFQTAGGGLPQKIEFEGEFCPDAQGSALFQQPVDIPGHFPGEPSGSLGFRQPAGDKEILLGLGAGNAIQTGSVKGDQRAPGHMRCCCCLLSVGHQASAIR
ncbi:hypothetical protein D3C86_1995880 [compost metagenome]